MSNFERALGLNSPEPTEEEPRQLRKNLAGVPCEKGSDCEHVPPILTGGLAPAENLPIVGKRRRGAPRGNTNALTHGYYASKLRARDARDLSEYNFHGLKEEILILRYFLRRVVEHTSSQGDLAQAFQHLQIVSLATLGLTRLLRTELILSEQERNHELGEKLREIRRLEGQPSIDDRLALLRQQVAEDQDTADDQEIDSDPDFHFTSLADDWDEVYRTSITRLDPDGEEDPDPSDPSGPIDGE